MSDPSLPGNASYISIEDAVLSRRFSASYSEGRQKFLMSCRNNGFALSSYHHPSLKGPSGEDLAIDAAWLGPENASRVVIFSCGTHGLEAAPGAATMLHWLETGGPSRLPGDMAVLLIHAINPFGWAWAHRINEDGIDLNRNFADRDNAQPSNIAYKDIHHLLMDASMDEDGLGRFVQGFHELAALKGMNTALTGITSGQYDFPDGLSFGGEALSWSGEVLFQIARDHLSKAEKIAHIDWHTGIGEYGQAHFILDEPKASESYAVLSSWWPDHTIHCDDVVEGVSIFYNGLFLEGLRKEIRSFSPAQVVNVTIEWGTYDVEKMVQALVMDNWLMHRAAGSSLTQVDAVRTELIERFYPRDPAWRSGIMKASETIYAQAISGLDNWSD